MKSTIFLVISLILLSCHKKTEKKALTDHYKNWETLEIRTRSEILTISRFSDSAGYYKETDNRKLEIPSGGKKIIFTEAEKDSLGKYIYESVTQPKFTDIRATDYAGNVIFKFDKGNMNLVCEYNSVGDWTEVSENTQKIYNLISHKIKLSKN